MPLKIVPPRKGKTKNYYVRGTYRGVTLDESTGSPNEKDARKYLARRKDEIDRDQLSGQRPVDKAPVTFIEAALAYVETGGDARFLGAYDEATKKWSPGLIPHFGETPITEIDQRAIDAAAVALYPNGTAATRNRQVYTPVSSILRHAGLKPDLRRPKGWRGRKRIDWLMPEQAFRLFDAADQKDVEFGIFLRFLCYTGCRLSEALSLTCDKISISEAYAYVAQTKNEDPRSLHLPPILVAALANHPRGIDRGKQKVFRFRKCGRLYSWMAEVKEAAGPDVDFCSFHVLRHTWATWMRRYAGLDTKGLVTTGAWKDERSASRYQHTVVAEESRKADLLPTPGSFKRRKSVENPWKRYPAAPKLLRNKT